MNLRQRAAAELANRVSYDSETGEFVWLRKNGAEPDVRRWNSQFAGTRVGTRNSNGYIAICLAFEGKEVMLFAHRVAWLICHGELPANDIDHINGRRDDNRICNLRPVTRKENLRNLGMHPKNTSGYSGVTWDASRGRWKAQVKIGEKCLFLGRFDDIEKAAAASRKARDENGFSGRDRLEGGA